MGELVRGFDCDTILLGPSTERNRTADGMIADCLEVGVEILPVTALYERHFGKVPLRTIDETWFITSLAETHRGLYLNLKRAGDLLCALVGLILSAPIMLLAALAIRLDSRGPVFYSQIRLGEQCRSFRIYKFRTMRVDAEINGAAWAQKNDPRITRLGGLLRKSRLDELPQLINVLRGDLSIVGPRPERPEFVTTLKEQIPFYNRRHMVKPGLTGWAQVRYVYGASIEDAREKLQYDLYYIKNRSLLLDVEIVLRTVWVVLMRKGAQ
jgi:exopolysaccharide biosynthesis polyprenyl glycosylphosphotransferase